MPQHANSKANLKPPWKPGESGNKNGRPPQPISDEYRRLADTPMVKDVIGKAIVFKNKLPKDTLWKEFLALAQFRLAGEKTDAAKEIREAIEGKASQRIDFGALFAAGGSAERVEASEDEPSQSAVPGIRSVVLEIRYADDIERPKS